VDISRVRSAERATQEGEERYRLLIENAREYAIFIMDPQGLISSWNPGAQRIFGYAENECIGQSLSLIFTEEDRAAGVPEKEMAKAAEEGESSDERWHLQKDGSTFWASSVLTALRHPNGDLRGFSKILRDNTDRKRAEAELQNRNQDLTRINSELEEFAYVASHDLQEPLRMINIYSQLLLTRIDLKNNPDATQSAEYVRTGVRRMESLMEDLLDYSRVVHGEYGEPVAVDSRRALDQALKVLEARATETGAKISAGNLPIVLAQEDHVALIFQNLLSNSLKYSKPGQAPEIQISARREGPNWVTTVADKGIGFSPKYAERIFGLFKRLHKAAYPGTGLGLAICKRVVQRYNGQIWATSAGEGSGASFSFALPAENENVE
jgi:PAS domain S-box-containing protein